MKKLDITALENIVDIAMMRFNIKQEDRKELASLFMAYTGEFIRQTCYPVIDTDVYKIWESKYGLVQDCCCKREGN